MIMTKVATRRPRYTGTIYRESEYVAAKGGVVQSSIRGIFIREMTL